MSKHSILTRLQWRGSNKVYQIPWLRNRIEFSANPSRIREFTQGCEFTRSQLTIDMLNRFHLSNHSIVVSDDEHAGLLRKLFRETMPDRHRFPVMARALVQAWLGRLDLNKPEMGQPISSHFIGENYISLLRHLLGADLPDTLIEEIRNTTFHPGSRPVHIEGLMFAFGLQLPGFKPMRTVVDLLFFRGEHYTRKIARKFEKLVRETALPKPGSWYSTLLDLKARKVIGKAQLDGELTSILVSSFSLSAAMCSMLLCLAARQEYVQKIRSDERLARAFVSEVLRLYSPFRRFGYEHKGVWHNRARNPMEATDFMVSVGDLHRDESVWPDAGKFMPERFLEPRAAAGCRYLPFGMGKRSCIGQAYSLQILSEVLKYVCSEDFGYELDLPEDYESDASGLPVGISGRLISFTVDDRICVTPLDRVVNGNRALNAPTSGQ
mgnify:CR=1 FL=1